MTDTIERMARAIAESSCKRFFARIDREKAQRKKIGDVCGSYGLLAEIEREEKQVIDMFRSYARAALSALEEPSHEMYVAGAQAIDSITEEKGRFDHTKIWSAMIKAAKGGEG